MEELSISVIIPTYNRPDFLPNTIKSLLEQDYENYEIIIVDNACLDETRKVVESFKNNKVPIIYINEPNIGLHNARHTGAKIAKGEIILYIDDDIIADKNLLKEIAKFYLDQNVGCVGGRILPKWEVEPPEWIYLFPKWYLSILDDEEGPKEVKWIYGCNFSIRKSLLFDLGGFNPDAFGDKKKWWMRGDGEIGLLIKVHRAGKKVIYNPNAVAWHFIPKERLTVEYFKERAFKSGVEASFSKYRYSYNSFSYLKIIPRISIFGLFNIFLTILSIIPLKSRIKYKVLSSYYKARCLYEFKLAISKDLQKFVKKESWLV